MTLLTRTDGEVSVFCGHDHMIDEAREANIRQFVTPAVSCQIVKRADGLRMDTRTFGYRSLEIDGAEAKTAIAD
jgi:3',5'-cyclic-AMP phosphodiesterase